MEENCTDLLIKYNNLFEEYNQALRFKDYGSNVSQAQKNLSEVKFELDENNYVKEYKKAYKSITRLLQGIEKDLFRGLIENKYINID